jgi:predicted PolB exonuclease-like 3'-5' exonuclease
MIIYLDVETIPSECSKFREKIASEIKPPATMKKAETIAEWIANEKENAIDEAIAKTSFDGGRGSIICIGYAINDSKVYTLTGDEKTILEQFYSHLVSEQNLRDEMVFVGHNISSFDLRFMFHRSVINSVVPPNFMPFQAKAWDKTIFDTMTYWAGFKDRVSLANLCDIFGIESDNTHTGADVYPMYKDGKIDEIASYCADDVRITREVYKRLTFNKC